MKKKFLEAKKIDNSSFKDYGFVLERPKSKPNINNHYETLWIDYLNIYNYSKTPLFCYTLLKKVRPICKKMECIFYNHEAYINLGDSRSLLFVAKYINLEEINSVDVEVFLLEKYQSVIINPGTWHFSPFPLDNDIPFLLVLGKYNIIINENDGSIFLNNNEVIEVELKYNYQVSNLT